jgi:ribosomal protein S18 acetylase RimI-like enzyme
MLASVIPVEALHPATDPALAAELAAVARAAYAVEARLIGHDVPVPDPRAAGPAWWGCRDTDGLLGAIAVRATTELVHVENLVVAPRAFRRGVGSALVAHVVAQAAGRRMTVATGRANVPARTLYERAGFTIVGHAEVEPGLWVTRYAR